jgi:hypothetical protein
MLIIPLGMMDFTKPVETLAEHIDAQSKETLNISRTDYLLTEFRVIVTYLRLLVFPVKQSVDYTYPVFLFCSCRYFYHSCCFVDFSRWGYLLVGLSSAAEAIAFGSSGFS